ncbi:MAG: transposase [Candidatus Pacebacteria bacterium]|nr:transposase [Candidatus Paceibacterota bacterium]
MKKPSFLNNHIYHIYNRGVEKRNIFLDDHDYFQFIHNLYEFNDVNPVSKLKNSIFQSTEVERENNKNEREPLVEILAFVLMPNHYHLLLRQLVDDGISRFLQKIGTGFTMSFNQKYDRVGCLFQGRFKAVLVEEESHLLYLPMYIHLNPIKISGGSTSGDWEFLKNYRWSSLHDYIGKKNFPSVISKEFLLDTLGSSKEYQEELKSWLKKDNNFKDIIDEIK